MDAFWQKIDRMVREALSGDAAQSGRPEAAAQAAADGATGESLGACPSNTPPSSSQIPLPGFPEYKSTFGIDWLETGGILPWPMVDPFENLMGKLEAAKLHCQTLDQQEVRVYLTDQDSVHVQRLGMKRGKSGGVYFDYRFIYKGITICLARRRSIPGESANLLVALRGTDCLLLGALEAHAAVQGLFARLGAGPIQDEKISRVDLRLDVAGLDVRQFKPLIDERCFVTRVREIQAWDNKATDVWTGASIGKSPRMLRIYDKKADQRRKYQAEIHRALIDRCWGGVEPEFATRLEFELGRTYLKRYGIHSVADLLALRGSLLSQLTNEFFRFTANRVDSGSKHQSRAQVHPLWQAVQSAFLQHAQTPALKLVPIQYKEVNPRKLVAQAIGCLVTAALQRKLAFTKFEEFVLGICSLVCEKFPDEYARERFLIEYWRRFKEKPGDFGIAA